MSYFVVPYTWIGTDDYGIPGAAVVAAAAKAEAVEAVRERVYMDCDKEFWGYAADFGDSPEDAGDDCFYVLTSCDCGDEDCEPTEDGDGGHDSLTVMVHVFGENTRECATLADAEAAVWDLSRRETYVFIDATDGDEDAQASA